MPLSACKIFLLSEKIYRQKQLGVNEIYLIIF